jgi:hypothetical protein
MGVATLEELALQAETLDRIERDIENINANLDRGDRYVRAMESVGGVLKNAFSKEQKRGPAPSPKDHTITLTRQPKVVDIDILLKNPDDSMTPCLLQLQEDCFVCINAITKRAERGLSWRYEHVLMVIMRARPLHMDIRFQEPTPRFRLMSSYLQAITNELVLRTGPNQAKVIFEPSVKRFQFGSFKVSDATAIGRGRNADANGGGGGGGSGFRPNHIKASDLLSNNASSEVRAAVDQQEEDLHAISNVLDDLGAIANGMSSTLDDQIRQIDRITKKVDDTASHMHNTTYRAKALI